MVIWLMGLPGAGKTTLGKMLVKYLKNKNIKCDLIDGDIVRNFFNNDLGYTKKERILNMKRIILSAYFLEQNNIIPIVCNISPFKFLRDFCKNKFSDYIEIYLSKPFHEAKKVKNKKNIYYQSSTPIVGRDIKFEIPENPDLILDTHKETPEESFQKLKKFLKKRGLP